MTAKGLRAREGIPGPSRATETRAEQGATTEDTSLVSEGGATQRREVDRSIRRREGISSRALGARRVARAWAGKAKGTGLSPDPFSLSAQGEIRTRTPYGATPSRWCVYQFHHLGSKRTAF